MLVTQPEKKERRVRSLQPTEVGLYNPGIRRIIENGIADLKLHDELFIGLRESEWQTKYSLLNHHERVRSVVARLGQAHRRNDRDVLIGELAAQFHDIGKIDPEMRIYRVNRYLSSDEKPVVDTHAERSARILRKLKQKVRPEDYPMIDEAEVIVCSHHQPYVIENQRLRSIGMDLHLADIFVSVQEDRHRPGLSQFGAIEMLQQIVDDKLREPQYEACSHELMRSQVRLVNL
jgi:hypothetical protein